MFKLSRRSAQPLATEFANSAAAHAANSSQAGSDVPRALVRMAFKDTLRATGLPEQWLTCEVRYVRTSRGEERLQVQLVMHQWNEHLLGYSLAFQKALMECLDQYEPDVDHSKHEWLWRFAPTCETAPLEASVPPAQPTVAATPAKPVVIVPAAAPPIKTREFELRDLFSDLTPESLQPRQS